MDPAALPAEVWILIFRYLPIKDLALSARVCARWRQISEDDTLWAPFFSTSTTAAAFLLEHRRKRATPAPDRPFMKRAWSEMAKIERNWIQGACQMTVLQLPEGRPVTCALIDEPRHRLILGTMATTLELVDLPRDAANSDEVDDAEGFDVAASGPRLRERSATEPLHRAHQDAVRALRLSPDGRLVASASNDLTVRVWDADTLEARHTLTGHTDSVRVLAFHEGRGGESRNLLLSCGRDKTVRVWDADQGLQLHSFEHTSPAHAISVADTTVAVGYSDATVRIWCLETGKQLQSMAGHTHWVTCLQYRPGVLVSGSMDKRVLDWDLRSGHPAQAFVRHEKLINAVLLHGPADDQVISCSTDGTIDLWSRGSGAHLHTLRHNPNKAGQSRADRRLEVSAIASRHYATRPDVATIVAANTGAPTRSSLALWEIGTDAAASTAVTPSLRALVQPGLSDLLSLTTSSRYLVATAWDNRAVVCDFGATQSIRYQPPPDGVEAEQSGEEEESRPYVPPWQRRQQRGQGQEEGQMPPPDLVSDE